ncbi:MAG: hypothetical protein AAGI09_06195 [Pseudomonadota bacterium]
MKSYILALAVALAPLAAAADSILINRAALPSKDAHGVARVTPLAITDTGAPSLVVLSLEDGDVVPAHASASGLRYLTVLSGDLSWGDGDTIVVSAEKTYRPGDMITISAGEPHWLAARNGPAEVQLILLHNEVPVPGVQEQMQ